MCMGSIFHLIVVGLSLNVLPFPFELAGRFSGGLVDAFVYSFLLSLFVCATLNNEYLYCLIPHKLISMSRKKKDSQGPMPAASAGLLRFFEEETEGIKIRPELLMILAVGLVVVSVLGRIF